MAGATTPLLELRGITKRFPGVLAIDQVSLALHAGEVHMLMGENGAGKSTLMKVLCGAYTADAGEILADGKPVPVRSAADATALGVAVIFQEYSLVPHLSIGQNIYLGREPLNRFGLVDHARMHQDARAMLDRLRRAITRPPMYRPTSAAARRGTRPSRVDMMAPTLVTSCTSLPPKGGCSRLGAARRRLP
ncbi:MAG: ATP-binding cassette domain-containing protein [Polaromonas sp.]